MSLSVCQTAMRMQKPGMLCSLAFAIIGFASLVTPTISYAVPLPISVTGFNRDLVLNNGDPTTDFFDVPNSYSLFASGTTGSTSGGLPTTSFLSATGSGVTYQFADFSANNALQLGNGAGSVSAIPTSGTLTLATASKLSSLYLLDASTNGSSTITYTLNYADGSTTNSTFSATDWFNGASAALTGAGRVQNPNGTPSFETPSGNPRLYEVQLTVDQTKFLNSIAFTYTTAGDPGRSSAAIFGVSGNVVAVVPEPGTFALTLPVLGLVGAVALRRRKK